MKLSMKEIERLNKVIDVLFQASEDAEVESIIKIHRAAILHHEDIIEVARNELSYDNGRKEEITNAVNNLIKEIEKNPVIKTDVDKYEAEIRQLQSSSDELCDVREQIKELLDQLDRRRDPNTGEAESVTTAEKKKRTADQAFIRNSPTVSKTKKARVAMPKPNTPSQQREPTFVTPLAQIPAPVHQDQPISDNYSGFKFKAPVILSPLLPYMACKLINVPDGKFEAVKWVPLGPPIESVAWAQIKYSSSRNFNLQEYKGWAGANYRIVARQPRSSENIIEIALGSDLSQLKQIMDIFAEIDSLLDFSYINFWNRIKDITNQ